MLIVAKFNKNIEKTVKVPQVPVTEMYNLYVSKDKMSYFCEQIKSKFIFSGKKRSLQKFIWTT